MSRGGASSVWLTSAGGSLPRLFGTHGDDGEGQEEHAGGASDDHAQNAAVHLHGLAALSRVEEGVIGHTPGNRTQGFMWEPPEPRTSQRQAPANQKWQRVLTERFHRPGPIQRALCEPVH